MPSGAQIPVLVMRAMYVGFVIRVIFSVQSGPPFGSCSRLVDYIDTDRSQHRCQPPQVIRELSCETGRARRDPRGAPKTRPLISASPECVMSGSGPAMKFVGGGGCDGGSVMPDAAFLRRRSSYTSRNRLPVRSGPCHSAVLVPVDVIVMRNLQNVARSVAKPEFLG